MSGGLVVATVVTAGGPDLGAARDFLAGAYPTQRQATAVVGLVVWLVVGITVIVTLTAAIRGVVSRAALPQKPWTAAGLFVVAGAVLLALGVSHHVGGGITMCCGSVGEATNLAR